MAMGSADEARLWCDYAADLEYAPRERCLAWQDELSQIARMKPRFSPLTTVCGHAVLTENGLTRFQE